MWESIKDISNMQGLNIFFLTSSTLSLIQTRGKGNNFVVVIPGCLQCACLGSNQSRFVCVCVCVCVCVQFFCNPMDCSLPGFSVPGISQTRILEWAAISFSRGSSPPKHRTHVSCIAGRFFTIEPQGKPARHISGYFINVTISFHSFHVRDLAAGTLTPFSW